MSEQQLYIRVRGRVSGPFTMPQLKVPRDRGQFRRFYEISPDRIQWTSASSLTELFAPEAVNDRNAPLTFPELEEPTPAKSARRSGKADLAQAVEWHYVDADGNPQGPVSQARLLGLWHEGSLSSTTLVWREGMENWLEITAPETGLGLVAPNALWGLPMGAWIGILVALACLLLTILGYIIYKWGEGSAG
jgi:hypothetical protein